MARIVKEDQPVDYEIEKDNNTRTIVLTGRQDIYEEVDTSHEFVLEKWGRLPDDYILTCVKLAGGNMTRASKLGEFDRSLIYKRCQEVEGFREQLEEIREIKLDFAEDKLWEHIEQGNPNAVMFYLKTIGKGRGYTTEVQVAGNKEKPVQINLVGSYENYG